MSGEEAKHAVELGGGAEMAATIHGEAAEQMIFFCMHV